MLGSLYNFVNNHRKKLYFGGGIIGGLLFLSHFSKSKFSQWHEEHTLTVIDKQKRKQHYEKTRQTANATVLSLSSSVSKIVSEELNMDSYLQTIRNHPESKQVMWEELKVVGFSRCIVSIYASALVSAIVHVQLVLLGGFTYKELLISGQEGVGVNSNVQEKYLSYIQSFIEEGLPNLITKIHKVVNDCVRTLSLNEQISLEHLEGIIKDITLKLCDASKRGNKTAFSYKLRPWSQYIGDLKSTDLRESENLILNDMTAAMMDILDTDDFDIIIDNLISHGINNVLDYVVDWYPHSDVHQGSISNKIYQKSTDADFLQNKLDDCGYQKLPEKIQDPMTIPYQNLATGLLDSNNPKDLLEKTEKEKLTSHRIHLPIVKSRLPLAKLVPVLSGVVYHTISPAPGHLLQLILLNEKLENFCFNIYEAFSGEFQ